MDQGRSDLEGEDIHLGVGDSLWAPLYDCGTEIASTVGSVVESVSLLFQTLPYRKDQGVINSNVKEFTKTEDVRSDKTLTVSAESPTNPENVLAALSSALVETGSGSVGDSGSTGGLSSAFNAIAPDSRAEEDDRSAGDAGGNLRSFQSKLLPDNHPWGHGGKWPVSFNRSHVCVGCGHNPGNTVTCLDYGTHGFVAVCLCQLFLGIIVAACLRSMTRWVWKFSPVAFVVRWLLVVGICVVVTSVTLDIAEHSILDHDNPRYYTITSALVSSALRVVWASTRSLVSVEWLTGSAACASGNIGGAMAFNVLLVSTVVVLANVISSISSLGV
jgi:hypothetical protein